jgi:hypothetical protein
MYQTKIIITLFFLTIIACNNQANDKYKIFVEQYKLEQYDTICAISCISCGGCIEKYVDNRKDLENTIFIFDDKCRSKFIQEIKTVRHISISQKILDSTFNEFGNIVILAKNKGSYLLIEKPVTE